MSLPTKRPKDDTQPILREDGKYALAINPRPILQTVDGKPMLRSLGVPYGAYPRVALIYLLSQAVTKRSRDVYLGRNFTEWMRRLGYQTSILWTSRYRQSDEGAGRPAACLRMANSLGR
jgi:hypothetical protein